MKIAGIYLAAGNSIRMGSAKLTLLLGGKAVGSYALETALQSSLDTIYTIIKETDPIDWLPSNIKANKRCQFIKCPTAHKGQSESLRYGIRQAMADQADAIIVMLADQPFITSEMIEALIMQIKQNPTYKYIATTSNDSIMPPVLFSAVMYTRLLTLQGDKGARAILQGDFLQEGKVLPIYDERFLMDMDTIDDYEKLKQIYPTFYPPI